MLPPPRLHIYKTQCGGGDSQQEQDWGTDMSSGAGLGSLAIKGSDHSLLTPQSLEQSPPSLKTGQRERTSAPDAAS